MEVDIFYWISEFRTYRSKKMYQSMQENKNDKSNQDGSDT